MKHFEEPSINVDVFSIEDVITTSGTGGDGNVGGEIFDDE